MKKVTPNGEASDSCLSPVPSSKNGGQTPTIIISETPKGGSGSNNDVHRSPDKRKEKKDKMDKERIEKERKKMEKEQKKSKGDSKEGKLDRFLGSKLAMEKFFRKKIKERDERKEKEKEERERERILAEEGDSNGEGGDAVNAKDEPKEKKKKDKKDKKDKKKKPSADYFYEAGSGKDDDDTGGDELKRKKKRKKALSSTSSSSSASTPDKDKDPMEREAEREEEREEEAKGSDSSDSSDSDDSSKSEEGAKGLLSPDGILGAARPQRRRKKDWTVSQEFRVLALETEEKQKPDFSFALQYKNRDKNRYGNALPNPETRVILKGGDTDYINANYIQGEQTQYIAAQAPLPNTFGDFWLMVWEQNTRVIMMLTRLTENDRTKAEIYWPRKGPLGRARGSFSSGEDSDSCGDDGAGDVAGWKQYGKMRVSLTKSTLLDGDEDVTIRHFRLRNDDEPAVERQVIQIHFTGWPDFGVPQNTKSFIQLLELMESFNKEPTIEGSSEPNGPIILHCSAGLGRTGTLIAAHIAAEKLRLKRVGSKEDIDMKAIVALLREQRSGMVQTKCQYKFLHDLLQDL